MKKILLFFALFYLMATSCSTKNPSQPGTTLSTCKLVWQDRFQSGLGNRWSVADWTFDHNLCEFSSNMVSVADGRLSLGVARKSINKGKYPQKPYWGAEVYTSSTFQYGRFETVMQPNSFPGMVTSFFLMAGVYDVDESLLDWYEIDIEFAGRTDEISFALHWMTDKKLQSTVKKVNLEFDAAKGFHTYGIEWTPTAIQFLIDGKAAAIFDDPAIMKELQHPMSIHANYWVSDNPDWVGEFHDSVLPQQTAYTSIAYYKLVET